MERVNSFFIIYFSCMVFFFSAFLLPNDYNLAYSLYRLSIFL